jgi:hypothetical protein
MTTEQVTDIATKPLPRDYFKYLRQSPWMVRVQMFVCEGAPGFVQMV